MEMQHFPKSNQNGRLVITLPPALKFENYAALRSSYESEPKDTKVEFDFRKVTMVDSSALGMLLLAREYFAQAGEPIVFSGYNKHVGKVFSVANFDKLFTLA
uniref:STAS domain-containing protein n=1 Tax=Magnetococcus massalia (strain MO-1) TaxID=451514 RepID=A0A1S7LNF3_MAGMO|nr:Conserved protein of unknown function [Candidatus Magnetococcus massalia]